MNDIYGTGEDGDATFFIDTTLTRIYHFNNLRISLGITLYTPFHIFIRNSFIMEPHSYLIHGYGVHNLPEYINQNDKLVMFGG